VECPSHSGLRHSEDRDWKKHNKGRSRLGAANFLKILPDDEAETATVADKTLQQQPAAELAEATDGIDVMMEDVLKTARMTVSKGLGLELGATNKELTNSVEGRIGTSLVGISVRIENHTNIVSGEPSVDTKSEPSEEQVSAKDEAEDLTSEGQPMEGIMEEVEDADLHQDEGMDSEIAKSQEEWSSREQSGEESGGEVCVEQIEAAIQVSQMTFTEDMSIRSEFEAEKEEPFTTALPPSAFEDHPAKHRTMVSCTDEQQSGLIYVPVGASQQAGLKTEHGMEVRGADNGVEAVSMKLPGGYVAPEESSMQMTCQHPPGRDDDILQIVSRNAYKQDPYVQEFGISINNRLANVEAQTLPFPRLKYHDTSWEECIPSIGQWNMMHKKMVNGGVVEHSACINFS
jgi:hypothetical protein